VGLQELHDLLGSYLFCKCFAQLQPGQRAHYQVWKAKVDLHEQLQNRDVQFRRRACVNFEVGLNYDEAGLVRVCYAELVQIWLAQRG
jgi:hypothetical protein